jgi:hypothetical protein
MNNLRISDGTTTVNLNNKSNGITTNYVPRVTDDGDGGINETAEIALIGNVATVRTALQNLNKLFRQAEVFQKREVGTRVFLEIQLQNGDDYWRSELLEAAPIPTSETLDLGLITGAMKLRLTWRRRAYWEGPETVLPLTNGNGTNVTTGITVHPINDATHSNYVAIAGTNVTGDLPAPIKLELENTYNDANRMGDVWMALNVNSNPSSLQHVLEGEDADYGVTVSSPVSNLYSNDLRGIATIPAAEGDICYWDLDNTFLQNCAGNDFRVLCKLATDPTGDIWAKMRISMSGLSTLYEGPEVKLNEYYRYVDLGVVRIPPSNLSGVSTIMPVRFELRGKRPAGSDGIQIDFIQLMPMDSYRKIDHRGYDIGYGAKLIDDQIDDQIYVDWSTGASKYQLVYGSKLLLEPGKNQRLYFFYEGTNAALRTASAIISYRPRRSVI